jgi:hypothetical protein
MDMAIDTAVSRRDLEVLLPWHAAGTLSRRDAERLETALARDEDLSRQYAMIREELGETIHLNETLGAPSIRAMERLLCGIDAESNTGRAPSFRLGPWIARQLSQLNPRTLAWSASAAALAIVLQAGLLAGLYVNDRASAPSYQTASLPTTEPLGGSHAWIGFAAQANAGAITKFLQTHKIALVGGPRTDGLYKVRVAETDLAREDVNRILNKLQEDTSVVRIALAAD